MYTYSARCIKVVDGDTVDLEVDLGFGVFVRQRFRLHGINTPEIRTTDVLEKKEGIAAKEYVIHQIFMKSITIQTINDKKGKYGRYLVKIFHKGVSHKSLNIELVDKSLATEVDY